MFIVGARSAGVRIVRGDGVRGAMSEGSGRIDGNSGAARLVRKSISLKTKIIGLLSAMLLVLLVVDIAWTYKTQEQAMQEVLLEESRILVAEMDAVWAFVSANQNVINYTSDGSYEYKGLHCAIAGKAVAAFFSDNSEYTIRFTKLVPRNLRSAPDDYETAALEYFESQGGGEYYGFSEQDDSSVFRYVSAMKVSENCIECHGKPAGELDPTGYEKEGWDIGDVAGAVSVVVPADLYFSNMYGAVLNNVLFFLAIILCMTVVIYLALTRLVTGPLSNLRRSLMLMSAGTSKDGLEVEVEGIRPMYSSAEIEDLFVQFESMATSLSSLYENLESQVKERTARLSEANEELECQRRHVEEVNSRLEQDNQYKSDFLAIVSHELRTPLTSILAFTDLMEENVPRDDDLARMQLDEIVKNGHILLEMVDNVLETARIQAGSEKLNLELIDLNDVVGMVEASSRALAAKKSLVFTTCVAADVPLIVGDWEKTRRILVNLVSNAIKFTDPGGTVQVGVTHCAADEKVLIKVSDNGIGIPRDKQALVFERFTQENMSTVRRYGGSGLGLSLVRDLARMLGGSVTLESVQGEGSVFTVALPVMRRGGNENGESHAD